MTIDTLRIETPTEREVVLTRSFDAPRRLVFDALNRPELLKRWYGPRDWETVGCEIDLKPGGAFHFVSRRADGKDVAQRGVYREVVPPERLVNTEWWEDWNPGEVLVTTILVEQNGRTALTTNMLYPSQEVRDTILNSGLKHGAAELYNKLDEYLAALASL